MTGPLRQKLDLWRESTAGFKSRFHSEVNPPVLKRDDIVDAKIKRSVDRGGRLQKLRLRFYPSIDVDRDKLFAGRIDMASVEDVEEMLVKLGFRNNPTAYVEVTDEHGPDDGSYSRTFITETAGRFDVPKPVQVPSIYKRKKEQLHVVLYELEDGVEILAHEERSAWLQPARHVVKNDASARIGVRDFRDIWFDNFGEELPGKEEVKWETTN